MKEFSYPCKYPTPGYFIDDSVDFEVLPSGRLSITVVNNGKQANVIIRKKHAKKLYKKLEKIYG